ncbi:unnamed protein product [Fusarium fujikuroi]|nr:unnamed protein product [Fusarium fujikuroi]VTT64068.1 unnamed protein product [Fusarium fujikuroi]
MPPGQVLPITFSLLLCSLPPTSPNLTFLSTCTCTSTFPDLSRRTLFLFSFTHPFQPSSLPNTLPTVDSLILVCVLNRFASSDCHLLTRVRRSMPQYTSRDVGDPSQIKKNKQSMADLKLRRLTELNNRLREDLERERIPVSTASKSIIAYCNGTRDYMVPSVWGAVPKGEDPYAPQQSGGCCVVM